VKLLFILIIFIILTTSASAGIADIDITDVLPSLIADGGNKFMEMVGNQMYGMIGVNNSTDAQTAISNYLASPNTFIDSPILQKQKDFNSFWFSIFYFFGLCIGAMVLSREKGLPSSGFKAPQGIGNKYVSFAFYGIILYLFHLWGLQYLFDFEWLLSKGVIVQAMDMVPFVPDNGLTYLVIAVFLLVLILFMIIRYLVISIVASYFLLLVCLSKVPALGLIVKVVLTYGFVLLFFRVILASVFLAGAGAIQSLGMDLKVLPYIALLLIMVGLCVVFMIMPLAYVYSTVKRSF
jgi:hypothetical protein